MSFVEILELVEVFGAIAALALLLFFYFKKPVFAAKVNKVLGYLPLLSGILAGRVKDKQGVFDAHDALVVLGRVSARIQETVTDRENKTFEDVEDEVFEIVRDELAKYEGMPGVPDLSDSVIQTQVRVVFEAIQRATNEDTAGNDR